MTALTERGTSRVVSEAGLLEVTPGSLHGDYSSNSSPVAIPAPRSVSALDACHAARAAWQRQDQQTSIDLWGDSPDHVEGHSRTTGGQAASRAGNGKRIPAALDLSLPDALNARPGPETARGPHAPISPPGSSVEDVGDGLGNGGTPASSLTTKQGAFRSTDAPEARSRREVMTEQLESTKVGVEVETPQPKPEPETQTTEVEVETPEGQPDVEVEVETPKPA